MIRDITPSQSSTSIFEWHQWFAWYPVNFRTDEGRILEVWLETIERKRCRQLHWDGSDEWWEYRLPTDDQS